MAQSNFIKIFNSQGQDCNFMPSSSPFGVQYSGQLFFPRVSVNLIESKQLFFLQEVTTNFQDPQLRKIRGTAEVEGGSPFLTGVNSFFTQDLVAGDVLQIGDENYTVTSVISDTSAEISPTPSDTLSTDNFYLLDYLGYNQLLSSLDVDSEQLVVEFPSVSGTASLSATGSTANFFIYSVTYNEDAPLIQTAQDASFTLANGASYSQDSTTGRIIVNANNNLVVPTTVNLGFSTTAEGVYQQDMNFYLQKTKLFSIDAAPVKNSDGSWTYRLPYLDYIPEFQAAESIFLNRTVSGGTLSYALSVVNVSQDSTSTYLVVNETSTSISSTIGSSNFANFGINLTWKEPLLSLQLYAEAEEEDERLRLTLENFGRNIDKENEYIFRDSDISEELTDYTLLNKKRKELLLQGDQIYPYLGSYRALVNVLNYFGYYDVQIKEYFLVVNSDSPDSGKKLAVPIPTTPGEKNDMLSKIWKLLPSKIYQKTSTFGLYYNLNTDTGEIDDNGIPIYVNDSQFTPEEVLIKLYGLKNLLVKTYLPINAKLVDITGDGIYFQGIDFETWQDSVQVRVLEIGQRPTVNVFPVGGSYIRDLRRIDRYYVEKFTALGYTGFLGDVSTSPDFLVFDNTLAEFNSMTVGDQNLDYVESSYVPAGNGNVLISDFYPFYVGSFNDYNSFGKWEQWDSTWTTMVPGIYDPNFNVKAAYYKPLPDDPDGIFPTGAPALIETIFALLWDNCNFSWDQVSTLQGFPAQYSIDPDSLIVTISDDFKTSIANRGFQNGNNATIANCPFDGTYVIQNVSGYTYQIQIDFLPTNLTGSLTYSQDISQISGGINRHTWDTIGRGEYLDMRVTVSMHGTNTFTYDTGRKPIDTFSTPYYDPSIGLTYNRLLDAVVLPYEGTYEVGVYIYDITNNFTMQYMSYQALTPTAEITASYQSQEDFNVWDDLDIFWNDATFDWYYPDYAISAWEDADLQWDSLQAYSYRTQSIEENQKIVGGIQYIDRIDEYVTVPGDYTGSPYAKNGDYLYFDYEANSLVIDTLEIPAGTITQFSDNQFSFTYSGTGFVQMGRVILKKHPVSFNEVSTGDFLYADVDTISGNTVYIQIPDYLVDSFSTYWSTNPVYIDAGVYSGSYAIEILSTYFDGNSTNFYLKDTKKYLYKLDGYFQPYLTTYDVDYASAHIGKHADDYHNITDVNWNDFSGDSWWAEERHPATNAGFLITQVAANGSVTVGDNEPFFFSGDGALNQGEVLALSYACRELNTSTNEGISQYEYALYPSDRLFLTDIQGTQLIVTGTVSSGSTSLLLSGVPYSLKSPAVLSLSVSGGTVSASLLYSGSGYNNPPNIVVMGPSGGTAAQIVSTIDAYGKVDSITVAYGGSGYTSVPEYTVDAPVGYQEGLTDYLWTGSEWFKVAAVNGDTVHFQNSSVFQIENGYYPLLPYTYHTQIFGMTPDLLMQFYFFILGSSKTPALRSLHEVTFSGGVEGEWADHPQLTYTYPLKNSLLFSMKNYNLSGDAQYHYWLSNGKNFPVSGYDEDDSLALYAGAFHEPFSYSDAVITPKAFQVQRSTTVVFHDDSTRLPLKQSRVWTIVDEQTGEIVVQSTSPKLMWNFSTIGNYTVSIAVSDRWGNVSLGTKQSFVTVV